MNEQKNILIIVTDQLTWKALPIYGNDYCQTPNINKIMTKGIRFDHCYTPCPLCQPARAAFWTGLYPHQTKVLSNGGTNEALMLSKQIPTLGSLFRNVDYDTQHFGKTHDAGSLRGFTVEPQNQIQVEGMKAWPVDYDTCRDRYTTEKVVEYLENKNDSRPYLLVADLQNPHDICNWVGHNQNEHTDISIHKPLPPLPDNFEFNDISNRPVPVQYICCSHNRQAQASGWTKRNYQHYLAAYYHYIERVDEEIGLILQALESRADSDNTLVVFMADHGDSMAARGHVTKQVSLYDETTRVPFAMFGPGIDCENRGDSSLISLLDIVPTLCDYSQIPTPENLWGKSLLPLIKQSNISPIHNYLISEWYSEWEHTISPGRMLRTKDYKYMYYIEGQGEELYDMNSDPNEKNNLASLSEYQEILNDHRKLLRQHIKATDDNFFSLSWKADKKWRSHELGYKNHTGFAAPAYNNQ